MKSLLATTTLAVCGNAFSFSFDTLDKLFTEWEVGDAPGCAVSVVQDGEQVYSKVFGFASLELNVPLGPNTVFYIASTSKQFTAAAIALLLEDGVIALEDDVRKYVPELRDYGKPITIDHLVHHTSGLRDYLGLSGMAGHDMADSFPVEQALSLISRQKSTYFASGAQYRYSNTNYLLLSVIVERVSGKSLRAFAQERIFKPLGMKNTQFYDQHTEIVKGRTIGHSGNSKDGWELVRTNFALVGDGGLLTTINDLVLWERNFYANRLGKQGARFITQLTTQGKLENGEPIEYGFGLVMSDYRGLPTVSHNGAFLGYQADMLRFPEQKLGIYMLCNSARVMPSMLTRAIADVVLEKSFTEPLPQVEHREAAELPESVQLSSAELAQLVGNYYSEELDAIYALKPGKDGLDVFVRGKKRVTLRLKNEETAMWWYNEVRFKRTERGNVSGFEYDGLRFVKLGDELR